MKLDQAAEIRREQQSVSRDWEMAGAREAIMSALDVKIYLTAIRKAVRGCPSLMSHVDSAGLRAVLKEFNKKFPTITSIRNVFSHQSESIYTLDSMNKNWGERAQIVEGVSDQNHGNLFASIGFSLMGENVSWSDSGKAVRIKLDKESINAMQHSCERVLSIFSHARDQQLLGMMKQMGPIP